MHGMETSDPVKIPDAFIKFYTEILGRNLEGRAHVNSHLIKQGPTISVEQRNGLEADFTAADVKQALWAVSGDNAPGPDGFGN